MPAYKDKHGRWRFRLQHGGKRYSGSTAKLHNTKRAAEALEKSLLERLERRAFTGEMPTVSEFSDRFLEYQAAHTAQLTRDAQRVHIGHVIAVLGDRRLDDIDRQQVDELKLTWVAAGSALTTINTRLDTFQRMLSLAVEWKILPAVPKLKRFSIDDAAPRFLSDPESARLVEHAAAQWRSMVLVALRTGLRVGELRGLQWGDVNFTTRSIRVARTDPGRPDMGANSPKSGKGRTVPMTGDAFACLRELAIAAHPMPDSAWVWPAREWRGRERSGPRSASGCFHAIVNAADAAGLEDIGWHTLRHTYASALVMRGVTLKVVQELLGHASIKQTEVYAHLAPGFAHHAAVQALDTPLASDGECKALPAPAPKGPQQLE